MIQSRSLRLAASLLVLICTVGCDQATKHLARTQLSQSGPANLAGGCIQLVISENPGGFLSLGAGLPQNLRVGILMIGVGLGLTVLLAYMLRKAKLPWIAFMGLALIWAGGASNLIDRFFRHGLVTDFIFVRFGPLHTGVFNVADTAIVAGALLLIASVRLRHKEDQASGKPAA
jgi:signal peptidase II